MGKIRVEELSASNSNAARKLIVSVLSWDNIVQYSLNRASNLVLSPLYSCVLLVNYWLYGPNALWVAMVAVCAYMLYHYMLIKEDMSRKFAPENYSKLGLDFHSTVNCHDFPRQQYQFFTALATDSKGRKRKSKTRVVGCVGVQILNKKSAAVRYLCVASAWRRQRTGWLLLKRAHAYAAMQRVRQIQLETNDLHWRAIALYHRNGYSVVCREQRPRCPRGDLIHMVKQLDFRQEKGRKISKRRK